MKYIVWAIAIILCFVFGRIMYSPLGPALLAQGSSASEGSERPTVIFGTGSNELRITINLKTVGEREMPTSVLLKKKTPVADLEALPMEIREMVRTGDEQHEEGKVHLEKAMNPKDDAERVTESKQALQSFREAQTAYTSAMEALDQLNLQSPPSLVKRARTNQQALVIARKRSF